MSFTIGEITYTNIQPMFHFLDRPAMEQRGFTFQKSIPSELNGRMRDGRIDAGGISSFEYASNPDAYYILKDLSVSSKGDVRSIFLFSKRPIGELNDASVALTSSSATSVHLLKLLLERREGIQPVYSTEEPDFTYMMKNHDACLLIGDDAIKAADSAEGIYQYDLGRLWFDWTGLPMTYALLAVRREKAENDPSKTEELHRQLHRSLRACRETGFKALTEKSAADHGLTTTFWEAYFQNLRYELNDEELDGLNLFCRLLYEEQYISQKPEIEVWESDRHRMGSR
ncbi:menaquinone biosynthetic enzyme MqnA/MqnD family protein [Alkalicoccus luteus]|uniref:Chorismate dehydratase n=1 Tax=Alkalicoccus luteus TaxID=1237094 RepID=A0A969TV96_9BACI|nr:menaquinone biosynthesis protein [Alkalicoccus luteus]NJP38185.1 menaquinone biosynthesis protein [Alkalicoccus luteus]